MKEDAMTVKELAVDVGDVVRIAGRLYDVVPVRGGEGVALEPAITQSADELVAARGGARRISVTEFSEKYGPLGSREGVR